MRKQEINMRRKKTTESGMHTTHFISFLSTFQWFLSICECHCKCGNFPSADLYIRFFLCCERVVWYMLWPALFFWSTCFILALSLSQFALLHINWKGKKNKKKVKYLKVNSEHWTRIQSMCINITSDFKQHRKHWAKQSKKKVYFRKHRGSKNHWFRWNNMKKRIMLSSRLFLW